MARDVVDTRLSTSGTVGNHPGVNSYRDRECRATFDGFRDEPGDLGE